MAIALHSPLLIQIGHGILSHSGGISQSISTTVTRETEKAWELRIDLADQRSFVGKTFWMPKSALTLKESYCYKEWLVAEIAPWFKPSGWTAVCLQKARYTN